MSWQQPTNGNWNLNVPNEETLRATRFNAQRNGSLGQLSLNDQLALQNMGGAPANNPYASQQGLYSSQMLSPQVLSWKVSHSYLSVLIRQRPWADSKEED